MRTLKELIDFESPDIKEIIEGMLSKEMLYFTSYGQVLKIVESAYQI
jgi:hypothetical protein